MRAMRVRLAAFHFAAPGALAFRRVSSARSSSGNQLEDQRYHSQHQQYVDESSHGIAANHAKQPKNQENDKYSPQHIPGSFGPISMPDPFPAFKRLGAVRRREVYINRMLLVLLRRACSSRNSPDPVQLAFCPSARIFLASLLRQGLQSALLVLFPLPELLSSRWAANRAGAISAIRRFRFERRS
jgi:hypothetical protein